jgi:hypothetical protein
MDGPELALNFEYISGLGVHVKREKIAEWLNKKYPKIAEVP